MTRSETTLEDDAIRKEREAIREGTIEQPPTIKGVSTSVQEILSVEKM